jgi:multidrug efflux pump subunit AcrB
MTSTSTLGSTSITLQFELTRNVDAAAQDVQAAITAAGRQLPQTLSTPPTYPQGESGGLADPGARRAFRQPAAHHGGRHRRQCGGTADLADHRRRAGDHRRRAEARDPRAGRSGQAADARASRWKTCAACSPTPRPTPAKGTINTAKQSFTIQANDQATKAEQYDDVILASRNGAPVRVRDVGHAVSGPQDLNIAALKGDKDGPRNAVILLVFKQPGANVIQTVEDVKAAMPRLAALIPPGMKIDTIVDRTQTIRASVADVEFTLALTIALVVLVILLFLRNVRATLIPAVVVPLSLAGATAVMYLLGFSLDNLSLMAMTIAVGFVVDDAIVVVENIYRHIEDGVRPFQAALDGAREIGFTVVSISVSLVAGVHSAAADGRIVGRLFREFAADGDGGYRGLGAGLADAHADARLTLPRARERASRPHLSRDRVPVRRAGACLRARARSCAAPSLRHLDDLLCHDRAHRRAVRRDPEGLLSDPGHRADQRHHGAAQDVSPAEMKRLQREVSTVLSKDPDIAGFGTFFGSGSGNTLNTARFFIGLKPHEERSASATQIIARLRPQIARLEGVALFLQPAQDITVGGRISRGQYQYTLQDPSLSELNTWAPKMLEKFKTLPQLADVSTDQQSNAPLLSISINRDAAARFGIQPQVIDDTLNDAFGQRQVAQYFTQTNSYFVVLEVLPELQRDIKTLDRIYLKAADGSPVPLSTLVNFDTDKTGALSVSHQSQFPAVTLSFNLPQGVALGQAVDAIRTAQTQIGKPDSLIGSFQGNAQAFRDSLSSQPLLILAALVVVYVILGVLYESFVHPITILSTLPSAGVGALLALYMGGFDLSVIGIVGIILLIGIVKKNGIMLVDFAIKREREGESAEAAIREAALLRFRPILMTTMAALLGGLALMFSHGPGSELRQPLGYAMVGGLALSQVLTLFTTPVVYLYLDRLQSWLGGESVAHEDEESARIAAQ